MNDKENERPERTEAEVRQTALIQDIRTFFKDRNAEGIVSSWTDASIPKIVSKIYLGSQDTPELRKAQELAAFILERHPDCRQFAQQLTGYVTSQTSARSQTRSPPNRSQTRSPLRRPLRTRTPTPSSHSSRIQKRAITPSKHSSLRLRKFKLEDLSITEEEAPDYRRLLIHSVVRGGLVQDEFFLRQKVHQQWSETERCLAVEALMLQARATDLVLRVLFL